MYDRFFDVFNTCKQIEKYMGIFLEFVKLHKFFIWDMIFIFIIFVITVCYFIDKII